jgi:serine/threonine protein kinase
MNIMLPRPGKGYLPREYLGGGRWKKAFRAVAQLQMKDVALLTYESQDRRSEMVKDVAPLFTIAATKYSEYVATPVEVFLGDDNCFYFVEELLSRPLDKVVPVKSGEKFLRIARDLCRGLQCLHSANLIHRDIKLDNCGLDASGRAKIFDLGNVTSNEGEVKGTIFTRAPELFKKDQVHTKACDVWSLGATLYALRMSVYPFVEGHEIARRKQIADEAREGKLSECDENKLKREMDDRIRARYESGEGNLMERAKKAFAGEPGRILCRMLSFDIGSRPSAEGCAEDWERLLLKWISPSTTLGSSDTRPRLLLSLESYLTAVRDSQISMTNRQWDQVTHAFSEVEESQRDSDLYNRVTELLEKVKALRGAERERLIASVS